MPSRYCVMGNTSQLEHERYTDDRRREPDPDQCAYQDAIAQAVRAGPIHNGRSTVAMSNWQIAAAKPEGILAGLRNWARAWTRRRRLEVRIQRTLSII